jgi:hypothetical protein
MKREREMDRSPSPWIMESTTEARVEALHLRPAGKVHSAVALDGRGR